MSNRRLALIEAEIASGGTDPRKDPTRDASGVYTNAGINQQTPAQRDVELQQYLENTPQRQLTEFLPTTRLPVMDPTMQPNNAPDTYTGRGLQRIVPSVWEDTLAHGASEAGQVLGTVAGAAVGARGGIRSEVVGGAVGNAVGKAGGGTIGENIANKKSSIIRAR